MESTMEAFGKGPGGPRGGPGRPPGPGGPHPGPGPQKRPTPGPGGPHPGPGPGGPQTGPGGPHPGPGPTHRKHTSHAAGTLTAPGTAAVAETGVLVLDEFLAPQELERLARFVETHESDFVLSEVVSPGAAGGAVDFEHRKSRVLYELAEHEALLSGRILSYLSRILPAVGLEPFPIARVEAQVTASNHGDFFRPHEDNGEAALRTRELTFVYFFHREPKAFDGGELRIYDPQGTDDASGSTCRAITPRQNQIVFFPSHLLHEISPVNCASGAFADSRFTLNGWFHRPE
jgi:SM-20-related protein